MNKTLILISAVVCLLGGIFVGSMIGSGAGEQANAEKVADWTCSMHPQISLPDKGTCPICEMDLIPRQSGGAGNVGNALQLNEHTHALARVETAAVISADARKRLKLTARIERDETLVRAVTILGSGRIDTLYANYIGMPVKKGEHLAEIFSPEFTTAATELLLAIRTQSDDHFMVSSAKRKLLLLGVSEQQIEDIVKNKTVPQTYTLLSPMDGVISASQGHAGNWFKQGQTLFELVNLKSVWLQMDVYESQIEMVHYGQEITMTVPSFPGREWTATVSFMQPLLNKQSRSIKVRAKISNDDGLLKPEMFAQAFIEVRFDAKSRVIKPSLKGKWISPMHPEIVRDQPGDCPVCGMALISGEEFSAEQEETAGQALLIPDTAPLIIGEQAVVYVETDTFQYTPRLVYLGHHVEQAYIVLDGLKAGEKVVKRGAFRLDSDLQIQARASMMSMWQEQEQKNEHEQEDLLDPEMYAHVKPSYLPVIETWFQIQEQLSRGKVEHFKHQLMQMEKQLQAVVHLKDLPPLLRALENVKLLLQDKTDTVNAVILADLSEDLLRVYQQLGFGVEQETAVMFCPMVPRAVGEGAFWLQRPGKLWNPFFEGGMPHCGEAKEFK